ncbi:MAG: transposase, partial [Gemmatimonadetes bacterium]|nr:transposase [Gemmatimonadota bacterium]
MIGLPRSTYYRRAADAAADLDAPPVDADAPLREAITVVRRSHPAYGYRRVTHALRREGLVVNKKRVQRVMRSLLAPPLPRRRSWQVAEPDVVTGAWYPNRRADCIPTGADQLWVADLT